MIKKKRDSEVKPKNRHLNRKLRRSQTEMRGLEELRLK